jgi:hypothetical protein
VNLQIPIFRKARFSGPMLGAVARNLAAAYRLIEIDSRNCVCEE